MGNRTGDVLIWVPTDPVADALAGLDGVTVEVVWPEGATLPESAASVEFYVADPHTWVLHSTRMDGVRAAAARFDPDGLLNPGKLL